MKLEDIGFYTLSDERASNASVSSPLSRCEIILTDACNFNCVYCRGLRQDCRGTMPFSTAIEIVDYWLAHNLKAIRFSGGEPSLYTGLVDLVRRCKGHSKNIAISTNGSSNLANYESLIAAGVNDFSISLDSGCCSISEHMAGKRGSFNKVAENIKELSKQVYVTVGMVFTEENIESCVEDVLFVHSLNPADIRVIPSAQYNKALTKLVQLSADIVDAHPILKYRINRLKSSLMIRGLKYTDSHKCPLVLDDMAIAGRWHFPCIIYLREGGNPIGLLSHDMRAERNLWYTKHNSHLDKICKQNCLDVCVEYNNKYEELHDQI